MMPKWNIRFPKTNRPDAVQTARFVGLPQWDVLKQFLEHDCALSGKTAYSGCSMAPGWNIKYKKKGRSVCTLYPAAGYFSCMVVLSDAMQVEADLLLPAMPSTIRQAYAQTPQGTGGKWLFLEIRNAEELRSLQALLHIRLRGLEQPRSLPHSAAL